MSTTSLTSTLSSASIEFLRSNGDLGPLTNGFRKIAHRSYTSLPTPGSLDVPETIESAETFVFMGLKEEIASNLQAALVRRKNDLGIEVSPYEAMKAKIKGCTIDACGTDEDYLPVYKAIGFNDHAADKLNGPWLQEWKNAYSAKEIALMAAESSYLFISTLDDVIRNTPSADVYETASIFTTTSSTGSNSAMDVDAPSSGHTDNFMLGPTFQHTLDPAPPRDMKTVKGRYLVGTGPFFATDTAQPPPSSLEGHKMLYKGGLWSKLSTVFVENEGPQFNLILSDPPGDFSKRSMDLDFTSKPRLAYTYAQLRANASSDRSYPNIGILSVAVPKELMASTVEVYGDEWKHFVYNCRCSSEDEAERFEYLRSALWTLGPVCMESSAKFNRGKIAKNEVPVFKYKDGDCPNQYRGHGGGLPPLLRDACKGLVWLTGVRAEDQEK